MQHCQHPYRVGCEDIAAIPLKSCNQCSHYRGGYCYGFGTAKKVFSTTEAILCGPTYTPLGQVQIGPLDSLAGQLSEFQIPSGIISTIKLADLAVTSAKLSDASVTLLKIVDGVITDAKIDAAAAIAESKLNLDFSTASLNSLISTNITDIASNIAAIALRELASNKDIANGYLGLDASALVPLAKLNPLLNAQIAAAAAIAESKLNLDFSTSDLNDDIVTRVLTATYLAHNHSIADPTQIDHANLLNVSASQHHPKYLDSEALAAAVKSESFGSGWSAEPKAPTEGTTYDHLSTKSVWPTVHLLYGANGALISAAYGATVKMPISDADCWFAGTIRVPDWWPSGRQAYLKVLYYPTVSSQGYSVTWSVGANGVGDNIAHTILNGSTGYDFPTGTAGVFARLSVDIGTSLSAQDVLTFTCTSDASNSTEIRIYAIWISTSGG